MAQLLSYSRAVALDPAHSGAWQRLGELHVRAGRVDEAVGAYRRHLELNPSHAHALVDLGGTLLSRQAHAPARRLFERAATLTPASFVAWYGIAEVSRQTKDLDRALSAYTRATAIAVAYANARRGLGGKGAASNPPPTPTSRRMPPMPPNTTPKMLTTSFKFHSTLLYVGGKLKQAIGAAMQGLELFPANAGITEVAVTAMVARASSTDTRKNQAKKRRRRRSKRLLRQARELLNAALDGSPTNARLQGLQPQLLRAEGALQRQPHLHR